MTFYHSKNVNSLYDAMQSSIKRIGIIQNNLDNVNTVSFKSIHPDSVLFSDTLRDVFRDENQGAFLQTQEQLDIALNKPTAFFLVEGADGPERTRDGQFHITADRRIVDCQDRDLVILDQDPNKTVADYVADGVSLDIDKHGVIRADGVYAGKLAIDYSAPLAPGDKAQVLQGRLEASNVDLQANITKLLQVKRHIDSIQGILSMELGVDKALIETYGRNV